MAYNDWWEETVKRRSDYGQGYLPPSAGPTRAPSPADVPVQSPSPMDLLPKTTRPDMAVRSPSPMDMPKLLEQGRRTTQITSTTGGGGGGSSLDKVFGPLFDALDQQRRNAESRYTANVGQIQNIYGQLIGARGADINDIQDAYNNLQQAASARGAATLGAMQAREQQRQSQNQAVLQSMGVGDIGSAAMDQAAEASQVAQDVAALGQSNWAGLLGAMGATAQDIARADITGYGYRQGEDIATLQGAKEDYLQGIGQQEFELKSQQALKELEAQQAAAAAQAKAQAAAAEAAAKAQEQQFDQTLDYLKTLPPLDRAFGEESLYRGIAPESRGNVETAYNTWLESASGSMGRYGDYTPATALQEIYTRNIAQQLSPEELTALKKAILYTFQNQ